jgi:hypothetical protein
MATERKQESDALDERSVEPGALRQLLVDYAMLAQMSLESLLYYVLAGEGRLMDEAGGA